MLQFVSGFIFFFFIIYISLKKIKLFVCALKAASARLGTQPDDENNGEEDEEETI